MKLVKCIKIDYEHEQLTVGKIYVVKHKYQIRELQAYYSVICDDGKEYSKYQWKFEELPETDAVRILYDLQKR